MDRGEQLVKFSRAIDFYEKNIEKGLREEDFDLARGWYREMCGAYFLAESLELLVDPLAQRNRQNEWFQRILDAQYGPAICCGLAEKK